MDQQLLVYFGQVVKLEVLELASEVGSEQLSVQFFVPWLQLGLIGGGPRASFRCFLIVPECSGPALLQVLPVVAGLVPGSLFPQ